ncbi:MAG: YajG family lipoprotein, partial [Kangiellaceae bacterium]|nr:YajG family lipoprotein [Kangiellaceae bacterium]
QKQLITKLKNYGYKIINKPLLADMAFELVINKLELAVDKSMLKSLIRGNSKITLTLRKHSAHISKIFSATKTQEVANPANNADVSGVVNQMLSSLFANMFSDQQMVEFSERP